MEMEVQQEYFDKSLDDIIREKFHQYKAPSNADGISPFFRKPNVVLRSRPQHFFSQKTQFKSKLSDYSNYLNHMAKKRVQRAHRNLDLRRRLIHIRAIKDKVDLRWKIVALMISKLKTSAPSGSFEYNQQPAINYQIQPSNLHTRGYGISVQPRISQNSIKQIEGLVGELPPWLIPTVSKLGGAISNKCQGSEYTSLPMSRQSHGLRNCSPNANEHYDNGLGDMPSLEYAPPINRASHVLPQLVPSLQSQPYQNHDVDERLHGIINKLLFKLCDSIFFENLFV